MASPPDAAAPSAAPPPLEPLLEQLRSDAKQAQRAACAQALPRLRKDAELHRALRELLRSGSVQTRFVAAWLLFRAEKPSLRLLPALLNALELPDGDLRWEAAQMLVELGRLHGEIQWVLAHEAREHASELRRRMALYALRELAPEQEQTEQVLLDALGDGAPSVRRAALACCAKLPAPGPEWLARGLELLELERDPGTRALVPLALARLAERNDELREQVAGVLERLAAESEPELVRSARLAQRRLGPWSGGANEE